MRIPRTTRLFRGQLDLAPFLCVVFPLAFTALFSTYLVLPRGARVQLPALDSPSALSPGEPRLIVAIDSRQQLYFENQVITRQALEVELARKTSTGGPDLLLIQADVSVPYGQLAELAAIARRAGVKRAVFGTIPGPTAP